ncbi:MAG: transglycosylase domain-containing protein, partial [Candidatus Hinthialibacter sp.]
MKPGMMLSQNDLAILLESMDYRKVEALNQPGEYVVKINTIEVWLNKEDVRNAEQDLSVLSLQWKNKMLSQIDDLNNNRSLENLVFTPLWFDAYYDSTMEDRELIRIEDVPRHFLDIMLFSEDRNFYQHQGYDIWGIARALMANVRNKRLSQGASTITQQLVRSLVLHPRREFDRKINEVFLSYELEKVLTKDQILEHYLNTCYFGQSGSINLCGVALAAKYYFNASYQDLSIAQSAMLTAIIPAPNLYNPFRNPEEVLARRNALLNNLCINHVISQKDCDAALQTPLPEEPHPIKPLYPNADFLTSRFLPEAMRKVDLSAAGFRIHTTLNWLYQQKAQAAVDEGLVKLEEKNLKLKREENPLQACLVSIDAKTGAVLALVGGRGDVSQSFNRVLQSQRQIGSVIKPFIYLSALEGVGSSTKKWKPNSVILDEQIVIPTDDGPWKPENYNRRYKGTVTLQHALENSLNIPAVKLSMDIGVENLARFFNQTGLGPFEAFPSIALGSVALSPLDVAAWYTAFTNGGRLREPYFI